MFIFSKTKNKFISLISFIEVYKTNFEMFKLATTKRKTILKAKEKRQISKMVEQTKIRRKHRIPKKIIITIVNRIGRLLGIMASSEVEMKHSYGSIK